MGLARGNQTWGGKPLKGRILFFAIKQKESAPILYKTQRKQVHEADNLCNRETPCRKCIKSYYL